MKTTNRHNAAQRRLPLILLLWLLLPVVAFGAELLPFNSDGCSRFPDGTVLQPQQWRDCCRAHDLVYWRGGTEEERLAADHQLQACVAASGSPEVGTLMLHGVRVGGSPWWPTPYRWGYGWPYLRGYEPLDWDEWRQVRAGLADAGLELPQTWPQEAEPVPSDVLRNWYRVSDRLYRSAQPSAAGFREVAGQGITTVLNLRAFHSDAEAAKGTGLVLEREPMQAYDLEPEEMLRALRVIRQAAGPVLVHCLHGADRTGTVVAMYRIIEQGWSKEAAIAEMTQGGFGYHRVFPNLLDYIREVDVERVRDELDRPAETKTGKLER